MRICFRWIREDEPGPRWARVFGQTWPAYRDWYLQEGEAARPGLDLCRAKLNEHMPELVPTWERLVALTGRDELAARMLSLYCPPAYLSGCSQAVWTRGRPLLVRNYDYHPAACEGIFLRSAWGGAPVLAASDCLWGALDGLNQHGLALALAFGGRTVVGEGFGIPLILRYVLERARSLGEAVAILGRVPSHMTYNISLLDAAGASALVSIAPDRPLRVFDDPVEANDARGDGHTQFADETSSAERRATMEALLADPATTEASLLVTFLEPPLHARRYEHATGTLYTAVYDPGALTVRYLWPDARVEQSLAQFEDRELEVPFPTGRQS